MSKHYLLTLNKQMKAIKKIMKWTLIAVLTFLVYVMVCLIHGTLTDFQPKEQIHLDITGGKQEEIITDKTRFSGY